MIIVLDAILLYTRKPFQLNENEAIITNCICEYERNLVILNLFVAVNYTYSIDQVDHAFILSYVQFNVPFYLGVMVRSIVILKRLDILVHEKNYTKKRWIT